MKLSLVTASLAQTLLLCGLSMQVLFQIDKIKTEVKGKFFLIQHNVPWSNRTSKCFNVTSAVWFKLTSFNPALCQLSLHEKKISN